MTNSGECRPKQDQQAPLLGGKEIQPDAYPQHGSIRLEKLPLGKESVIWPRGDSISTQGEDLPRKKLRVVNNPKSVSLSAILVYPPPYPLFLCITGMWYKQVCVYFSDFPFNSVPQWDRYSLHGKYPQH